MLEVVLMPEEPSLFFVTLFGGHAWIATFLASLLPLIELRGAIPFGMSIDLWGDYALKSWEAFLWAFAGSSIIVPVLALIFKPIVNWLDKFKFFHTIINYFTEDIQIKSDNINNKSAPNKKSTIIKMLTVLLFVAFPIPLTGVWTGTCFGVLLGLSFWQICLSVILGNLICGSIIITVCSIFPNATNIILYIFLALMAAGVLFKVITHLIKTKRKNKENSVKQVENEGSIEVLESNTKCKSTKNGDKE